jgi:hypothetical protein
MSWLLYALIIPDLVELLRIESESSIAGAGSYVGDLFQGQMRATVIACPYNPWGRMYSQPAK